MSTITNIQDASLNTTKKNTRSKKGKQNAPPAKKTAKKSADVVSMSDTATAEKSLSQASAALDKKQQRAQKVHEIKQRIQAGSYRPNLGKIATILVYDDGTSLFQA